jgi:hypothetical protein
VVTRAIQILLRPALIGLVVANTALADSTPLNSNADLQKKASDSSAPAGFTLEGDASYGDFPDRQPEVAGRDVRFFSARDKNGDGLRSGSLSQTVAEISSKEGRWFRFRVRGLAQDGFHVERDDLFLKVEFFRDGGTNSLDHVKKSIYPDVVRQRDDLQDKGTNRTLGSGAATWRSYDLEFRTPFPQVDTLRLCVGFAHGAGRGSQAEFRVNEFELTRIPDPAEYAARKKSVANEKPPAEETLVPLGGRWFYDPRGGERTPPREFDHTNADRLYYRTDKLEAPFRDNMSAWLRRGFLDRSGNSVKKDRLIADSVKLDFTRTSLIVHSHNLPNHPTAVFPDRWRALDGNPNYVQEQSMTWSIPLVPRENPDHVAMQAHNANWALPGGPIGVAVNGVVFFNPFDADSDEAIWRLDRCCGHPSPGFEYHYHKYPVCVKSPWSDDGTAHSPLIGFAFDGFPIFGPYETAGELAKDSKTNPLNAFNVHYDEARGWHYHVTPGRFPHLIGGYWGVVDARNRTRPPRPRGGPGGRFRPPLPPDRPAFDE